MCGLFVAEVTVLIIRATFRLECLTQKNIHDAEPANRREVNRAVISQADISNIRDDEVSVIRSGFIHHQDAHSSRSRSETL